MTTALEKDTYSLIDECQERIAGTGILIDMLLQTLHGGDVPADDYIESLRYVFSDRFDREREALQKIQVHLDQGVVKEKTMPQELEGVYPVINETELQIAEEDELMRDEINQIYSRARTTAAGDSLDMMFYAVGDAYLLGYAKGRKSMLKESGAESERGASK